MAPTNSTPPGWSYQPWSGKIRKKVQKIREITFHQKKSEKNLREFFSIVFVLRYTPGQKIKKKSSQKTHEIK